MPKPSLVTKGRKTAVHWLRLEVTTSKAFATFTSYAVACGQPLDEVGVRNRTTKDPAEVTCAECYPLANPPKSTMF